MIDFLNKLIAYLGTSNIIAIVLALITLFFAGYFYFRTFYRIIYSTGVICPTCKELGDFIITGNDLRTRVLLYNNGRKTITKDENKELSVISKNGIIKKGRILKGEGIGLSVSSKIINIEFDFLDEKDFFIIEVDHIGALEIHGRISETGKILNTEPRNWVMLNILFFAISIGLLFFTVYEFINIDSLAGLIPVGLNIIIVLLIAIFIRYIHSLFFIPDRISSKYLKSKNKVKNEFDGVI